MKSNRTTLGAMTAVLIVFNHLEFAAGDALGNACPGREIVLTVTYIPELN